MQLEVRQNVVQRPAVEVVKQVLKVAVESWKSFQSSRRRRGKKTHSNVHSLKKKRVAEGRLQSRCARTLASNYVCPIRKRGTHVMQRQTPRHSGDAPCSDLRRRHERRRLSCS